MALNLFLKKLRTSAFLLSVLFVMLSTARSGSVPGFDHRTLHIDPTTILDTLLAPVVDIVRRDSLQVNFERELLKHGPLGIEYLKHAPVLFFYRDPAVAPLFRRLIKDATCPMYFRMRAVHGLGLIGDKKDFSFLLKFLLHPNSLFREYIACALGKTGSVNDADTLRSFLKHERNRYVRTTLEASIRRMGRAEIEGFSGLPVFDTSGLRKLAFFPSTKYNVPKVVVSGKKSKLPVVKMTQAKGCIAPHQQYKANEALYELIEFPLINFGLKDSWGLHVGEDSGWLFDGMPVHAIMGGIVVALQYESTWGCLVVLESSNHDGSPLTIYYGHLAQNVDVSMGDHVQLGQKIGEIAPSFSFENGGYLAHLHLGIEKGPYSEAQIKGWSYSLERWYSPVEFIEEARKQGSKEARKQGRTLNPEP